MTMARGLSALILLSIMIMIETLKNPDNIALTEAGLGQTVTLNCNASGFENGLFFWYKMNYGYMVQTVATGSFGRVKLEKHFENSRFKVNSTGNMHYLTISNVSKEDEATYLCQAGAAYKLTFVNGTNLAVNDSQNKKSSYVKQTSGMKSVSLNPNDSAVFTSVREKEKENMDQCTDEHNVFWFRAESESNPGFIYVDKKRCSTQEGGSCEYRLSKTIQSPSDTGTYYCAVVTCGEILFGEGTKVETRQEFCLYAIVLSGFLACSVLVNIILIIPRRKPKRLQEIPRDVTATTLTELDEDQPYNVVKLLKKN